MYRHKQPFLLLTTFGLYIVVFQTILLTQLFRLLFSNNSFRQYGCNISTPLPTLQTPYGLQELLAPEPEHCPGTESEEAGKADACQGCPNQEICASAPKGPDPDLPLIRSNIQGIRHKILVLSGKGGVGKSTFTSMLGWAFAADENLEVGLMDVDVCGPSMPRMMGVNGERVHSSNEGWTPVYVDDNLAVMSIGFLLPDEDNAVIWRGPKKNGLIKQFLKDVVWEIWTIW